MGFLGRIRRGFARSQRTPEEQFTDDFVATIDRLPGIARITKTDGFGIEVRRAGETGSHSIFLGNLFAEVQHLSAGERREAVQQFVAAMFAQPDEPESWEAAAPRLRPVLRTSSYAQAGQVGGITVASRPSLRHLVEMLVIDHEHRMSLVNSDSLEQWGVTFDEAYQRGAQNLMVEGTHLARLDNGVLAVASEDTYESSRLVVPGWLAGLGEELGILPVAVVPSRDMMLIADGRDNAAVLWILEEGMKIFADHPRWLSPVPYKADEDGDIVAWRPEEGHPAFDAVRLAERTLETFEYREQKNRLEKLFRQAGEDLLVGDYEVETEGTARSVTTWPRSADALLPYADEIVFPAESGSFRIAWTSAARLLSDEWEEAPTTPPRRRTLRWPDEETLARLRAQSSGV
ncbi:uncharacterized protein YtpQ (UPF0354 family) [Kibdelosporangium banguiense]|uniref:Uncharacterized protein YtpQ (UPF0354 family) n=1 Tax=Kibdelosporangium banguiense TaxID=1365924 RepID=A0ABS4T9U9_9PSEU|nr:DUF1444 family protein [Kibdelosporangium banguiense]MBP2321194.1 uncharacterized protein YtpQ (UPF0354 family) [Kibdelosporangium banguiense]